MDVLADPAVFSIPLRHRWNILGKDDIESLLPPDSGMIRFIGDRQNLLVKTLYPELFPASVHDTYPLYRFSPIVLHGPSGTGKTTIALTSISWQCDHNGKSPICLSASDFDRRYRSALDTDQIEPYRQRFYLAGGIVIDNLNQLANKVAAQDELQRLMDQLVARQIPLLITSNVSPSQLNGFSSQLISRLYTGLNIPMTVPGSAARYHILQDLADLHQIKLTPAALRFLSTRWNHCPVPLMMLGFNQISTALHSLSSADLKTDAGLVAIEEQCYKIDTPFLFQFFQLPDDQLDRLATSIINLVASEMNIKRKDLISQSRKQSVVLARSVAIFLIRESLGASYSTLGRWFGNRDHSTIMHSYRKVKSMLPNPSDTDDEDTITVLADDSGSLAQLIRHLSNKITAELNLGYQSLSKTA